MVQLNEPPPLKDLINQIAAESGYIGNGGREAMPDWIHRLILHLAERADLPPTHVTRMALAGAFLAGLLAERNGWPVKR